MRGSIRAAVAAICVVGGACAVRAAAQPALPPQEVVPLETDSGFVVNEGRTRAAIFASVVDAPGAAWLRLDIDELVLGAAPAGGAPTVLRVTSLLDGHRQHLDEEAAAQWALTTAYFNGPAVLVELVADPGAAPSRVSLEAAWAGVPDAASVATVCGSDDRVLSSDPRIARVMPIGCTAWIIDDPNRTMLSARHCYGSSSFTVAQFNVPLSTGGGAYVNPAPQHQYPVDASSVQNSPLPNLGDDWVYFGCFPNSETGLTPYQAQGVHFVLDFGPQVAGGEVRVTGHGTVSAPMPPQWNGVQTTHAGPFLSVTSGGAVLEYQADTTGGNSGSPIIDEDSGLAIGIHTNGGCGGPQGNFGMSFQNPGLLTALASPRGVCIPVPRLTFAYAGAGPPQELPPGGGSFAVTVVEENGWTHASGSGVLHLDAGDGWIALPMTEVAPLSYEVTLPELACGTSVRWYVTADTTLGDDARDPATAPAAWYDARIAHGVDEILVAEDFEAPVGWTVTGDATDGAWEAGVPAGAGDRGDPTSDYDGSGACFLTDNVEGNSDVDGGATILLSPSLGPAPAGAYLSYARWYDNSTGGAPFQDVLLVEISGDGGQSWQVLETVGPDGPDASGGWRWVAFAVDEVVGLAGATDVRLRITAEDAGTGSVVEAAFDALELAVLDCEGAARTDLNGDGITGFLDLVELLAAWGPCPGGPGCLGDIDGNGTVGFPDLVEILTAWD